MEPRTSIDEHLTTMPLTLSNQPNSRMKRPGIYLGKNVAENYILDDIATSKKHLKMQFYSLWSLGLSFWNLSKLTREPVTISPALRILQRSFDNSSRSRMELKVRKSYLNKNVWFPTTGLDKNQIGTILQLDSIWNPCNTCLRQAIVCLTKFLPSGLVECWAVSSFTSSSLMLIMGWPTSGCMTVWTLGCGSVIWIRNTLFLNACSSKRLRVKLIS